MTGTDLAYVRAQLRRLDSAEMKAAAKAVKRNVKTLERLLSKKTKFGRTDTIGLLANHFRLQEARKQ